MMDQHTTEAALWRLHGEAAALLREIEAALESGDSDMGIAGKLVAAVNAHFLPLRTAVGDVEFYREAERIVAGMRVVGSLDGVAG